jgi:hypothetical protein
MIISSPGLECSIAAYKNGLLVSVDLYFARPGEKRPTKEEKNHAAAGESCILPKS